MHSLRAAKVYRFTFYGTTRLFLFCWLSGAVGFVGLVSFLAGVPVVQLDAQECHFMTATIVTMSAAQEQDATPGQ